MLEDPGGWIAWYNTAMIKSETMENANWRVLCGVCAKSVECIHGDSIVLEDAVQEW